MADEVPQASTAEASVSEQKADRNAPPLMAVKVYAPFQVYYEGDAYSVSAENAVGPFDIMPGHRNFLCMLVSCTLQLKTPAGDKAIKISRALMHVKSDRVEVFVGV